MKKLLLCLVVLTLAISFAMAAPVKFVFGDLGQHAEILKGFIPSYLLAGAGYDGLSLIEGNTTEIQFLLGAGYNQRKVWQDPVTGEVKRVDPIIYDVIETDWTLRFLQGFLSSPVEGKDLLTLSFAYEGKFEVNKDSMVVGKDRNNPTSLPVRKLDNYLGKSFNSNIYPDLKGNHRMLGANLNLQLKLDMMDDKKTTTDGFVARFDLDYSPLFLNRALDGEADYYSLTLNAVVAKTIYKYQTEKVDWFSIVLIDRVNFNWTDGSLVPVYAQGPVSLGRKVRGFNTWTYNTNFTAVNNFDVRFAGPNLGVKGIFPRINLFFDMGYAAGNTFNTSYDGSQFLASTGAQFTISFFDFIDLGYQLAYLFKGDKFTAGSDRLVGSFTFFLDF